MQTYLLANKLTEEILMKEILVVDDDKEFLALIKRIL
jgi:hypothetical protein